MLFHPSFFVRDLYADGILFLFFLDIYGVMTGTDYTCIYVCIDRLREIFLYVSYTVHFYKELSLKPSLHLKSSMND